MKREERRASERCVTRVARGDRLCLPSEWVPYGPRHHAIPRELDYLCLTEARATPPKFHESSREQY